MSVVLVDIPDLSGQYPAQKINPAPEIKMISIADMRIDARYQRQLTRSSRSVLSKILRDFSWSRFGVITVAEIDGGKYAVVDGQHRAIALRAANVKSAPCVVTSGEQSVIGQAKDFIAINMNKTGISRGQAFRAKLAAGDVAANGLYDLANSVNCRIHFGNCPDRNQCKIGDVFSIAKLEALYAKSPEILKDILLILQRAGRAPFAPHELQVVYDLLTDPLFKSVAHEDIVKALSSKSEYQIKAMANQIREEKRENFGRSMVIAVWKIISDDGMIG